MPVGVVLRVFLQHRQGRYNERLQASSRHLLRERERQALGRAAPGVGVPLALPLERTYHKRIPRSTSLERPLRRDARENRDRILAAARTVFAELGTDATVEEIASRAGVGIGTLYRRFPTKDTLIDAVFKERLEQIAMAAEHALADTNPWDGLRGYLSYVVGLQAAERSVSEILGSRFRTERHIAQARTRIRPLVEQLIDRAQGSGELRQDIVYEDISVLLWTTGRVVDATREVQPEFWQRYLALMIDSLRARSASRLPRPALTAAKHREAMSRFAEQRAGNRK